MLLIALLLFTACRDAAPPLSRPSLRLRATTGRAPRYLHARTPHHTNSSSTWNVTRLVLSGDVELNPGPEGLRSTSEAGHQRAPVNGGQSLTCFSQNVRSIKNKLGILRAISPVLERFDILALTETWLKPCVSDSELQHGLRSHMWFRRDREGQVGGGVACAVRASLHPLRRSEVERGEMLVVDLMGLRPAVTVVVGYRPPDDDAAVTSIASVLDSVCSPGRTVIMLGDYNLPEIVWRGLDTPPELSRRSDRALGFLDCIAQHGLRQHVLRPTREGHILDLVLTNTTDVQCEIDVGHFDSDHRQIIATCVVPRTSYVRVTRSTAFNYRRADFDALKNSLRLLPWDVLDDLDVNDAVELFYR